MYIAVALIPGAVLGALAGVRMPDFIFNKILAFIMVIVAVSMAIRKYRHKNIYDTFAFSNNLKRKPLVYIPINWHRILRRLYSRGNWFFTNVCPQLNRRNESDSNKHAQSNCSGTLFDRCTNSIFFRLINFMVGRNCSCCGKYGWRLDWGASFNQARWQFYNAIFSCDHIYINPRSLT